MGQKVTMDLDVVTQAEFSRLAMRVSALEGGAAAARVNEAGRNRRLDLLEERLDELAVRIAKLDLDVVTKEDFQRLAQHVGAACTNVADHERELTLLRVSVQNIQQWIAERAIEKHAAQKNAPSTPAPAPVEEADDPPPNNGPAVARACPKGTTKVWLGLTKMQAEDLLKLVGNIVGRGDRRDRTFNPICRALVAEGNLDYPPHDLDSTLKLEPGAV